MQICKVQTLGRAYGFFKGLLILMMSMSPYRAIYSNINKKYILMVLGLSKRYAVKWSKSYVYMV